jgi:hypothetical protein
MGPFETQLSTPIYDMVVGQKMAAPVDEKATASFA